MRGYHAGQRAVQRRAGDTTVAERLEHGIRPALPDAAREFLEGLPLLFVASADPVGSVVPQLPQKRAPVRFSSPQLVQRTARLWPQLSQKRRPAGFSAPQFEQTKRSPFYRRTSVADSP